jgi:hypothetical protein
MAMLSHYELQAAPTSTTVSASWPAAAHVARDTSRFTLVMFLHPQCPCSRASVAELATLMSRSAERLSAKAIFVAPTSAPAGWVDSDLWRQVKSIPGVVASVDQGGADARTFAATASGDVSVYDRDGILVFHGGITESRGHEGDNAGLDAILALVRGEQPAVRRTSVFGCAVND